MTAKLQAQHSDLTQALKKLEQALAQPETEYTRDSAIQRFEFTFEMSWKIMHSVVKITKPKIIGVKAIIREAADLGLIDNPGSWLKFLESRNLTVHTYKQDLAKKIYEEIKTFPLLVSQLLAAAKPHLDS